MYHILYLSTPVGLLDDSDYLSILNAAHRNNKSMDVTGMLLATEAYFMQYLEGEKEQVLALYDKIRGDKRHSNLFILEEGPCEERLFGGWQMGFEYMNFLDKIRMEALSPILKSPNWAWSEDELAYRPIYVLDRFRRQFTRARKLTRA